MYPYFLVYVKEDGTIHIKNTNLKNQIYIILCQGKDEPIDALVKVFNKKTNNENHMSKYTDLSEKAVFDIKEL